jgi:hypothetical protein
VLNSAGSLILYTINERIKPLKLEADPLSSISNLPPSFIPLDCCELACYSKVILEYQVPFKMAGKEDSKSARIKKTLLSDLPVPSSPTECPTPAEADAMLAKEMNQLSVDEREKVFEDVHGIARAVDEPLDYVKNSLVLLEEELSKTPNKVAFDLAKFQSKEYVSDEKLRLMFLRAENFDVCMAASRMVKFFDEKYELFGPEKLTKEIILADLDPGDIAALERGFYQVLPEKDCAGRKVLCFFPKLQVVQTTQNMVSKDVCEAG